MNPQSYSEDTASTRSGPLLQVRLFGGLVLTWGDAALPPTAARSARSLLASLITYRRRAHTRDLLAGTFWPDLPDARARRRLSQALWQIGRVLNPLASSIPYILTKPAPYGSTSKRPTGWTQRSSRDW
jgi:DNA-binding SARP family transcriptional activator